MDATLASPLALVDLSSGSISYHHTPVTVVRAFLGGRGLNMYYLYKYLPKQVDALSPENVLIFGTGLLTGTPSPSASRMNVSAKSPESRALGDANIGGFFGAKLRAAGLDRLILFGRAEHLVYLYVDGGRVEIRDARHLQGLDAKATPAALEAELGKGIRVACIAESGEKMVRFAGVRTGLKSTAARGGMGAVMGSKKLKAVVVREGAVLGVARRPELLKRTTELKKYLANSKVIQILGRVGTPFLYEVSNHLGAIRTHNSQLNGFDDSLNAEEIEKLVEKMVACFGCSVHCRHRNKLGGEGPDYTTVGLLGANLGISGAEHVIELNNLCNDLGLDTASTGSIIGWAIELYERGIITEADAGRTLRYGDFELMRDLIKDIAGRRGFGDVLAESTKAVARFGEASRDYLIAIKDLPQSDPHDVRYIKAFSLAIAVASRGADHLRNRPTLEILNLPEELTVKLYGAKVNSEITAYDTKEYPVIFSENIYAVVDSLGLCKFICHGFNSPHLVKYGDFADLICLATGWAVTEEELRAVGPRIVNLERMLNAREGLSRQDDTLPRRYFEEPMAMRVTKGHRIEREKFEELLSAYYRQRNWDDEGYPPQAVVDEINAMAQPVAPWQGRK